MLRPGVTQEYGWAKETKENIIDASLADGEGHTWELQSVFPSTKVNCSKNTKVSKQAIKRGEKATTSPKGFSYPKSKASIRMEVNSECHNATEADLPIAKKRT
ncbi:hypothetical protein BHE74_00027741 [Ensete ventricosum]|nr:hypothetical protein BHE74_00027741 [Ensete ventricosum]